MTDQNVMMAILAIDAYFRGADGAADTNTSESGLALASGAEQAG